MLERTVHLVDTPSFDDSVRSDEETLQEFAYWLVAAYEQGILLSGIVLLHRITDTRLYGSAQRALEILKAMCGQGAFCGTVIATTMWDQVSIGDRELALDRHEQLRKGFFSDVIAHKGYFQPLMSAKIDSQAIVKHVMEKGLRLKLALQKELVDENLRLHETTVGKVLANDLLRALEAMEKQIDGGDMHRTSIPEALCADRRVVKEAWEERIKQDHVALRWSTQTYLAFRDRLQVLESQLIASSKCPEVSQPKPTVSTQIDHARARGPVPKTSRSLFDANSTALHNAAMMSELQGLRQEYENALYSQPVKPDRRRYSARRRETAAFGVVGTGLAVGQLIAALACNVM